MPGRLSARGLAASPRLYRARGQAARSRGRTRAGAAGIREAAAKGDYREAFTGIAALQPAVARFFDDVLVMAEDERVRAARLGLVASLRGLILDIADISEMVTD